MPLIISDQKAIPLMSVLTSTFYRRDTATVARDLLGKVLVRRLDNELLGGVIVETEAYFGGDDPASRAYAGLKTYNRVMFEEPGRVFIYNVHKYWMLNLIAHDTGVGGILIRAIEPTMGVEIMKRNRPVKRIRDLSSGPGKLTLALDVDKRLNGVDATSSDSPIYVLENKHPHSVGTSHRIGVTRDLPDHYRYYVENNEYVSK